MAGLGFKDFQVGEVLTSSDVDGYLMQQTVMRFADAGARGSALGTATGTAVPLAEGMVSYLDDSNGVEVYTGSGWSGIAQFDSATLITATDASWSVPALANPVVRVTVIGAGGGGGSNAGTGTGITGGSSSFACSAGTATAAGGVGGSSAASAIIGGGTGARSWNAGRGRPNGHDGQGGEIVVAYFDLSGVTTANVTVGAGGGPEPGAGAGGGSSGGRGEVLVEYRAA